MITSGESPSRMGEAGVPQRDDGPIGPFPSWGWVYGTVLVYGVVVIGILTLLTRILSVGQVR
jgi:hypothetical protein